MKSIMVHAGLFHADDVLCVAMARILNHDVLVERVFRVPDTVDDDTIVADIGGGKYDHHQTDVPLRSDGFPHCAASLMWADGYGEKVVSKLHPNLNDEQVHSVVAGVDSMFLRSVAAIDNGCKLDKGHAGVLGASEVYSLNNMVSQFNPSWNSQQSADESFEEAVAFVTGILKRNIARLASSTEGESVVAAAVEQATRENTPEIIVLPYYVPWQGYVCRFAPEAKVLVFPALRGGWNIQLVPVSVNSRDTRIQMPSSWWGLSGSAAQNAVNGMTFCHKSGFLAAFGEKERAICAAKTVVTLAG